MDETIIAEAVLTRPYIGDHVDRDRQGRIVATVTLRSLGGQKPRFSVTGEIYEGRRREPEVCGCIHEEIVAVWPELAPLVALHLADEDGSPLHAEANGGFWLNIEPVMRNRPLFRNGPPNWVLEYRSMREGTWGAVETDELGIEWAPAYVASTLRIPEAEVRDLRARLMRLPVTEAIEAFHAWCVERRPTWKAEADAGLALIRQLADFEWT